MMNAVSLLITPFSQRTLRVKATPKIVEGNPNAKLVMTIHLLFTYKKILSFSSNSSNIKRL